MNLDMLWRYYDGSNHQLVRDLAEQALAAGLRPRAATRAAPELAHDRALAVLKRQTGWVTAVQWAGACGLSVAQLRNHIRRLLVEQRIRQQVSPLGSKQAGAPPLIYTWRTPVAVVKDES